MGVERCAQSQYSFHHTDNSCQLNQDFTGVLLFEVIAWVSFQALGSTVYTYEPEAVTQKSLSAI